MQKYCIYSALVQNIYMEHSLVASKAQKLIRSVPGLSTGTWLSLTASSSNNKPCWDPCKLLSLGAV